MRRIEVIFEFKVRENGMFWTYRGVRSMNGLYRLERRGPSGRKFKAVGEPIDSEKQLWNKGREFVSNDV